MIALIGSLRFRHHRSVPEIHRELQERQVAIAERTVTHLVARYEELVALRLADQTRLQQVLTVQGHVILAIDGLQPHKDQDVLWVLRDVLSGEVLLARSLDSARQADLANLLREVTTALPVPIHAAISDGQPTIRLAIQQVLPDIPHQLCHFHYLKEAAKPITAADHRAQTELKKYVKGVRDIERSVASREDKTAGVIRAYCGAVRTALTDAGHPPLHLPGLALHTRLTAIQQSLERVQEKKGCRPSWSGSTVPWRTACLPPRTSGRRSGLPRDGLSRLPSCSATTPGRMRQRWSGPTATCSRRC